MSVQESLSLSAAPFSRSCAVVRAERPVRSALKAAILRGEKVEAEFVLADAPLPPLDQTRFRWAGNDRTLLLGAALPHSAHAPLYPDDLETEGLELLFDLHHDGLGYQQSIFGSDGSLDEFSHLPYPETHSSSYPLLKPRKWTTETGRFTEYLGGMGCRWFWVWFDAREVFRHGDTVGFNLCRGRATGEFSSWNYLSGNGAPDAGSFGVLHRYETSLPRPAQRRARKAAKPSVAAEFKLSVTYDSPDNLVYAPLTPEKLSEEMELFRNWGLSRVHWIDYSDFPAMWEYPAWRKNTLQSIRNCGGLTACAAEQAHAAGLELIADFKVFDLGISAAYSPDGFLVPAGVAGAVPELEGDHVTAIPEIAAHPEWTLQANPAWAREATGPLATIRLYSDEPIRRLKPADIKLLVSEDNFTYQPYRGRVRLRQGTLAQPHHRWTPAGLEREKGSAKNWFLELAGLRISAPFVAVEVAGEPVLLSHRGFLVMEALDARGRAQPHTFATSENISGEHSRFRFWKEWPGWGNVTEPLLRRHLWKSNSFGIALREARSMSTILEPACEGARAIWLQRLEKLFDAGADGVNIRIFNHHNGVMNYLKFAFAPDVLEQFQARFGRAPETTPEDYEQVRRLRGEAFTTFMRDARRLADARGKKLMTQLESGIEVPPHLDTRMQLHIDWQTWLTEGLVDEVNLKFFSPYSRFVHEQVLPLARRKRIPVHVVSRNLSAIVIRPRAQETIPLQIEHARRMGFDGYNYYEAGDLYERNPLGGLWMKGLAEPILTTVRDALQEEGRG